jgi:hypothetical protein
MFVMAEVNVNIKNTFFEFEGSTAEPFAAAGSCIRRVKSCPFICYRDEGDSVFNEDHFACPPLSRSDTHSDAIRCFTLIARADPAAVDDEDTLSGCTSIDHYSCWQSSDTLLSHAGLTGKVGESTPSERRDGQVAAAPSTRTPLSSKARSFAPSGCKGAVFAPGCPQVAGALDRAPFCLGQGSAPGIPQLATDANQFTTLFIGNLPNGTTRDDLINVMNEKGFEGDFDFIYLPPTRKRIRYAFVNLLSDELTHRFIDAFNGFTQWPVGCRKGCTVTWAAVQGLNANIDRYRNSSVMRDCIHDSFKPVLFVGKKRAPFPEPTTSV